MIGKVSRGSSAGGLLRYLYGPGRSNEHENAHLVAAWREGVPDPALQPTVRADVRALARQLSAPLAYAASPPDAPVWQCSVRTAPGDRVLTDGEWAEVARDVMDRTGIARRDDAGGCRWVAIRHAPDHVHIAAVLARQDGEPVRFWGDYQQVHRACRAAEEKFGLTAVVSPDGRGTKDATYAEREKAGRRGHPEPDRDRLRREVRTAAAAAGGAEDFLERLRNAGVMVRERRGEAGELTGYAVAVPGAEHRSGDGRAVFYSGGKLAGDLTLPRLAGRWSSAGPAAAEVPRVARLDPQERAGLLRAAAASARAAASGDLTPGVAAAAGDGLLAAARLAEGGAGGPLTATADEYARAHRAAAVPRTGAAAEFAGATAALLRAGRSLSGQDDGLADLVVALAALTAAVARYQQQADRLRQATAARAAAEELTQWRGEYRTAAAAAMRTGLAATAPSHRERSAAEREQAQALRRRA